MSAYRKIFPKTHTVLAVVHVEDEVQALRNACIAVGEGVDGIFLINHRIDRFALQGAYYTVRQKLPNLWIGLNMLDLSTYDAIEDLPRQVQGLWVDDGGIEDNSVTNAEEYARVWNSRELQGLYFGGVAFKGQRREIHDVARAAERAISYMDVVTTSGPGTGIPADVDKIRRMKEALEDHPLAIASGITPENVGEYMPYADCFLVATGISDSESELNPARVRALMRAVSG